MITRDLRTSEHRFQGKIILNLASKGVDAVDKELGGPSSASFGKQCLPQPTTETDNTPFHDTMGRKLPAGWERCEDPNGKAYYVDHNTRSTTWFSPVRD